VVVVKSLEAATQLELNPVALYNTFAKFVGQLNWRNLRVIYCLIQHQITSLFTVYCVNFSSKMPKLELAKILPLLSNLYAGIYLLFRQGRRRRKGRSSDDLPTINQEKAHVLFQLVEKGSQFRQVFSIRADY
jgi:hypothetical protein